MRFREACTAANQPFLLVNDEVLIAVPADGDITRPLALALLSLIHPERDVLAVIESALAVEGVA